MAEVETREAPSCDALHRIDEKQYFSSDHIYLAAFLVCSGKKIIGTTQNRGRTAFVFEKTPELAAAVAGFMAGALVPARQFCFELLKLKRTLNTGVQ